MDYRADNLFQRLFSYTPRVGRKRAMIPPRKRPCRRIWIWASFDASPGEALVSQLVGVAIQAMALNAMEPNSPYGTAGQTVKDRIDELAQQRKDIKELVQQFDGAQRRMSDQDWISYKDRWRAFGEEAALRWMVSKYGQK
jgi:hypothetical protein